MEGNRDGDDDDEEEEAEEEEEEEEEEVATLPGVGKEIRNTG